MRLAIVACGLLTAVLVGCSSEERARDGIAAVPSDKPLSVYTVNYPLAYFAERIGGEQVDVSLPVPSDVDPAYWSPDPEAIAGYQAADLILLNGAGYAKWISRASLPHSKLVDTTARMSDRLIPLQDAVTHTHGPTGEHSHSGHEFTTWLDPRLALVQAVAIRDALAVARPESAATFTTGLAALEADIRALDAELTAIADEIRDVPLVFSHPVYQYLIRSYDLTARSIHWEPTETPDEAAWTELETLLVEHPAQWIVWEAEPRPEIVERLESLGLRIAVYDPCAQPPSAGDWMAAMLANVEGLKVVSQPVR